MNYLPLEAKTKANVESLCQQGYQQYDQDNYAKALRLFYQAWLQLPKPQSQYQHAPWILSAIGDCYFKQANYQQALEALNSALHCPAIETDSEQQGFIHTRLGQSYFQCQQHLQASKHFELALSLDPAQVEKISTEYRHFIENQKPQSFRR